MKYIIIIICLAIVVVFGVRLAIEYIKVDNAKIRVTYILKGLHDGPGEPTPELQKAISQWYDGSSLIADRNTLSHASNQFDAWLRKKNLYKTITNYEITEATLVKGSDPPVVIVSCMIEGKSFKMEVPRHAQIRWID